MVDSASPSEEVRRPASAAPALWTGAGGGTCELPATEGGASVDLPADRETRRGGPPPGAEPRDPHWPDAEWPELPLPRARRRTWRTLLRRPRPLGRLAPRIAYEQAAARMPTADEVAHWGEVILLEDLCAVLHRDGTTSWLTHIVTMPHGDENLAQWDQLARVYNPREVRFSVRRALVHLPDGHPRKAKRVSVQVSQREWSQQLTFAPLRPGVVIEFEEQQDQFRRNDVGPAMWAEFLLRGLAPCRRRRVTIAVAAPFTGRVKLHHCPWQPSQQRVGEYEVWCWDLHDLDGIETDAWTPPPHDFAPWVDVTTLTSWEPIARHYRHELLPDQQPPEPVRKLAAELSEGTQDDRQRLLNVYRYATRDVRYGRHPSEQEVHRIRETTQLLEDLRGDCKDKCSLMVSLLAEMKIPATIAILLSAPNGRTPVLASQRFDHAVVRVELQGREIWLDPAAGPYTFGDLPQGDQGVRALLLDREQLQLVSIPLDGPRQQQVQRHCEGYLDASGNYVVHAEVTALGERAATFRALLLDRNHDHRCRLIQQSVAEERPGAVVDQIEIKGVEDLGCPMVVSYRVTLPAWARRIENLLLLRVPWSEPLDVIGPISAATRRFPLQMPQAHLQEERHVLQLPAGWTGYGLPFEMRRQCPWAAYENQIHLHGATLVCQRHMETRGGIVPPDEFAGLKAFWETCARADQADVVLVRTGSHVGTD